MVVRQLTDDVAGFLAFQIRCDNLHDHADIGGKTGQYHVYALMDSLQCPSEYKIDRCYL